MINQVSIDDIKGQLINNLSSVLSYLLPKGTFKNNKFYVGDVEGNKGKSLVVELIGPKAGVWHDFATNEGGDILSLWSCVSKLDIRYNFSEVLASVQKWLDTSSFGNRLTTSIANTNTDIHTAKWDYNDVDGNVIATVYRYDTEKGKEFRPYDVKAQKFQLPKIRPLYNLPGIKASKKVVLVEGEKAAQALIDIGICATTAMNGANAPIDKTDWSPFIKKDLIIWPDNDVAGRKYARTVAEKFKKEKMHSLSIVTVKGKRAKWDAADAVEEKEDITAILKSKTTILPKIAPFYSVTHAIEKTDPVPKDLVAPRILTSGGLCVIGGAPKIGKSDFLLNWLLHMAAGLPFLGMTPSRPLRVAYLQAEVRYHFICERVQQAIKEMDLNKELMSIVGQNLFFTPHMQMILDKKGVELIRRTIKYHFDNPVDIIAIDPLRYVFDGGKSDKSENDNGAMKSFLQERIDALRDSINPSAANILVHHIKKLSVDQLATEEFQALAGASALHCHFSTGILMYKPDPEQKYRKLIFELRDGKSIDPKNIEKVDGSWKLIEQASEGLVAQDNVEKLNAEDIRKKEVILKTIEDEAGRGNVYTMNQFCEAFSKSSSRLGSPETIRRKLNILATKGEVKFFDGSKYDLPVSANAKYGYICVKNMKLVTSTISKESNSSTDKIHIIKATHFKCKKTGAILSLQIKNN